MKKFLILKKFKSLALLALLMISGNLFAQNVVQTDCSIKRIHSPLTCYSTTLKSVTHNIDGTYTIVILVAVDGSSGGDGGAGCQALSHYAVQAAPGTYSNVSWQPVSGNVNFSSGVVMSLGGGNSQDFDTGFKLDGASNFGDNHAGSFTVTYTLTSLQDELFAAKAGSYSNDASFTIADFQQVLNCGHQTGPTAVNDVATTPLNTPVNIDVLANDVAGSSPIVNTSVQFIGTLPNPATVGTFSFNSSTHLVTFTPVTGYTGIATVGYQITDGNGLTSTATITVTIIKGPSAYNDAATTPLNTPVNIDVLANDVAGSSPIVNTSVTFVGTLPNPATVGTFSFNSTTHLVTFTPVTGYTGTATVSYQIKDGNNLTSTATITVTIIKGPTANNDAATTPLNTPVAINVLTNDVAGSSPIDVTSVTLGTQPPAAQGAFSVNHTTGLVTFTPALNYTGTSSINYTITDGNGLSSTATITVTISNGLVNNYPATGFGTLAFEDLWPSKGDYDMNDLVVDYQFVTNTNTNNFVDKVTATFVLKAFGASFENGFGFQLPGIANASDLTVTGSSITEYFIHLNSNGTEMGQTKPTIIVFDNAFKQMTHPGIGTGVNTDPSAPYVTPKTLTITITFKPNTYTYNDLDLAHFNPFLIQNKVRGIEVHLPNYAPTSLADAGNFGRDDDNSIPSQGRYYKTVNNLPWAINFIEQFDYPKEKIDIIQTYLHFADWATSGGTLYPDWYKNLTGYRNASNVYQHP